MFAVYIALAEIYLHQSIQANSKRVRLQIIRCVPCGIARLTSILFLI